MRTDDKLRTKIGVAASADQRTFADGLREGLDTTGLTESELRQLVRTDAITSSIKTKYTAEVPTVLLQSKVEVIATQTEADAKQQAIDRINAGEDFATVAKAVSKETDVQTTGGLHDYGPQGSFNSAYDDYAFSGEIGKLSAPLSSGGTNAAFYVVRVIDRSDQPVQDEPKSRRSRQAIRRLAEEHRGRAPGERQGQARLGSAIASRRPALRHQ